MHTCTRCHRLLPHTDFHRDRTRPSGIRPDCRRCVNQLRRQRYLDAHPDARPYGPR